jgi:hypothetical protein
MTAHDRTGGHGSPQGGSDGGADGIDAEADAVLLGICASLADLAAFTVTADASTDVILRDGRELQLVATTTAAVNRAAGFRMRRAGPFGAVEAVHDGATPTVCPRGRAAMRQGRPRAGWTAGWTRCSPCSAGARPAGPTCYLPTPCGTLMNGVEQGDYMGVTTVRRDRRILTITRNAVKARRLADDVIIFCPGRAGSSRRGRRHGRSMIPA